MSELKLWDIVGYGVVILERPGDDLAGKVTLCKEHYEQIEGLIWGRVRREVRQMRAMDRTGGDNQGDGGQAADADDGPGGAVGDVVMPGLRGCNSGVYISKEGYK